MWVGRIILEAGMHAHNCFVTLTYKEAPKELEPETLQLFFKRLRAVYPVPFRYYAVGEYGERTLRPHYHAALFGVSMVDVAMIEKAWGLGFVHVGELNPDSAQYLAAYVVKKMTRKDDPRLEGKFPEFARMSLKPGIGKEAALKMGGDITKSLGATMTVAENLDVPNVIRMGGKMYPVGRYLRRALRAAVGWDESTPQEALQRRNLISELESEEVKAKRERLRENSYDRVGRREKLVNQSKRYL